MGANDMTNEREQAMAVHAAMAAEEGGEHYCGRCFNAGYDAAIKRAEQAEATVLALTGALQKVVVDWEDDYGNAPSYLNAILADTVAVAEAARRRIERETVAAFWTAYRKGTDEAIASGLGDSSHWAVAAGLLAALAADRG